MDDLGVPLFLETPNLNHREPKFFDPTISHYLDTSAPHQWSHTVDQRGQYPSLFDLVSVTIVVRNAAGPRMPKSVEFQKASHTEAEKSDLFISLTMGIPAQGHRHKGVLLLSYNSWQHSKHIQLPCWKWCWMAPPGAPAPSKQIWRSPASGAPGSAGPWQLVLLQKAMGMSHAVFTALQTSWQSASAWFFQERSWCQPPSFTITDMQTSSRSSKKYTTTQRSPPHRIKKRLLANVCKNLLISFKSPNFHISQQNLSPSVEATDGMNLRPSRMAKIMDLPKGGSIPNSFGFPTKCTLKPSLSTNLEDVRNVVATTPTNLSDQLVTLLFFWMW